MFQLMDLEGTHTILYTQDRYSDTTIALNLPNLVSDSSNAHQM